MTPLKQVREWPASGTETLRVVTSGGGGDQLQAGQIPELLAKLIEGEVDADRGAH